jgi:U3 small nucleolar RNA-associated protein 23
MRHLYKAAAEPGVSFLIDKAKTYERRRCGHRPEDYPEPLSTKDCLATVVDPKDNKSNKNCYVIASQELEVRKHMRGILGVPLSTFNVPNFLGCILSGADLPRKFFRGTN